MSDLVTCYHQVLHTRRPLHNPTVYPLIVLLQSKNCSLHLLQRFSHLSSNAYRQYILSRESAPGIIMASGVVGSNLTGETSLFVSNDAGVTWNQVHLCVCLCVCFFCVWWLKMPDARHHYLCMSVLKSGIITMATHVAMVCFSAWLKD